MKRTSRIVAAKRPTLGLSTEERAAFRAAKLTARDVEASGGEDLHRRLCSTVSRARCDELAALADFQRLGSVGLETARNFIALGFACVADLKGQDPRELHARMCELTKSHHDPCVEDAFRCAIAQVEDPSLPVELRDWWHWTKVRGQPMSARP
ncbi:MAG: helix-hairpin-helix domain-containing protein [Planctomycetota bacterium]|nr:helix-hairpin-helix domain-containing protein [Planctomycetota bacterium]